MTTMERIDAAVRKLHTERENHPCEGYWTEREYDGDVMRPRRFVPTCCNRR